MSFLIAFLFLSTTASFATVTINKIDCPVQFEGKVKEIVKEIGGTSTYSTQSVIFKNLGTIKGKVNDQIVVEMLEHGPFEMEVGEDYRVQINDGRICWVEKI